MLSIRSRLNNLGHSFLRLKRENGLLDNYVLIITEAHLRDRGVMQDDHKSYHSNLIESGGKFSSNSNLMITVPAGQPTTISSHHLSYLSPSLESRDVMYRITKPLTAGEGHLVLMDHPRNEVQQFTQADVNDMKLIYIPPSADNILTDEVFSMRLALVKAHTNMEIEEQKTFRIRVQPPNQLEPKFKIENPTIQLNQVSTTNITKKYFEIDRTDDDDPNLTFVVTEMPTSGSLIFLFENNSFLSLDDGNEFYLENFDTGVVQYRYHGDNAQLKDTFEVLATDGNFEVATLFNLEIIPQYPKFEVEREDFKLNRTDEPIIQFEINHDIVKIEENGSSVRIPIERLGDVSSTAQVWCYTLDTTALAGKDFTERPLYDNKSLLVFASGITKTDCEVFILDDRVHEGEEEFIVRLERVQGNSAALGERTHARVKISDSEDRTRVQFERAEVTVSEPANKRVNDVMLPITINVVRKGDTSQESRIHARSQDGSAQKGMDYEEFSQMLMFSRGVETLPLRIRVLYRPNPSWVRAGPHSFSVALIPDGMVGTDLGDITSVTIIMSHRADAREVAMKVLPSRPVIVSLLHYDRAQEAGHIESEPSSGYPLVCISSCDERYPFYNITKNLCQASGFKSSVNSIAYSWEVAAPSTATRSSRLYQPFKQITDSTVFADAHSKVLDPSFFAKKFRVRCITTPVIKSNRKVLGVPVRSKVMNIASENEAICLQSSASRTSGSHGEHYREQSFLASLQYVDASSDDVKHRNEVHVHIEIPHVDGMLPLVSTLPLSNPRVLLVDRRHTSQHMCSNLHNNSAFLAEDAEGRHALSGPGFSRPHQLSEPLRGSNTVKLYRHLDLGACLWTFDAWFHMSQLVDNCGGKITSEFQVRDNGESYVTVQVPLFVSYIFARVPPGWTAVDHRTELEVSFYYSSMLWHGNVNTQLQFDATIQVTRVSVDEDGRLVVEFNTVAHFRGHFVLSQQTLPRVKSEVIPPSSINTNLTLELLWSQDTWDGPQQAWRATSTYSLQDYSGDYVVALIPCSVPPGQSYYNATDQEGQHTKCTAQTPTHFKLPLTFQQSSRPAPLFYNLDTRFTITNSRAVFLAEPSDLDSTLDYPGVFLPGEAVYGRVLWHPAQPLHGAYTLSIQQLYLCTGADGYMPKFDPKAQQFGCLQTSPRVKHSFLLLDRDNPRAVDRSFEDIKFEAYFASDQPDYNKLESYAGVDGFIIKVDPLYKINSGYQWYLQVLYTIGPTTARRSKRGATKELQKLEPLTAHALNFLHQNGTNMKSLRLGEKSYSGSPISEFQTNVHNSTLLSMSLLALVMISTATLFWWLRTKGNMGQVNKAKGTEGYLSKVPPYTSTKGEERCLGTVKQPATAFNSNASTVKVQVIPIAVWKNFSSHEGTEV